ncbi:MAG: PAS domain-containing protein, partial [Rhodocyclaceae bacterium]|nr:PAS domain-containing protein [Rhodocyclaceae bacterium]
MPVVGIGASAGGLEAIRELLHALPCISGLAFVIVQHLDPSQPSQAVKILGRFTAMPVRLAEHALPIEANHVYCAPPGKILGIQDGCFTLTEIVLQDEALRPIDHFFRCVAAAQREQAAGVILSGTGNDGALGLEAIVAEGGLALVQDPETTTYPGMPRSAIGAARPHFVVPVGSMPALLMQHVAPPPDPLPAASESSLDLRPVLDIMQARFGIDFAAYKPATVLRRVERRMALREIATVSDYARLLAGDTSELAALHGDLLIGVTQFFRDPDAWAALATDVLAPLVDSKGCDEPIRVWVPGVSQGEEAYTLSMLLIEHVEAAGKRCPIRIFATDTNENVLAFARAGIYPQSIDGQIAASRLARFFHAADDGKHYRTAPRLRETVIFGAQNLLVDPPFSRMDLVSCRNLLIYLQPDVQKRVIQTFHFALNPHGYLFLGTAETIGQAADLFAPISSRWPAYRHIGRAYARPADLNMNMGPRHIGALADTAKALSAPAPRAISPATLARQIILDHFSPACVLLNGQHEIQYYCGPTEHFLKQPQGTPTTRMLTMLRDGLRSPLVRLLNQARESGSTAVLDHAHVKRDGRYEPVRLTVMPAGEGHERMYLVAFQELQQTAPPSGEHGLVQQFEEELRVTKDDLQRTIEHLEASNEALHISHEQVVSMNEELQSANEELESSKEELQSFNEELNTVNQQLQAKVAEMAAANTDLQNLLASSDVATIYLDRQMRIRWFTPTIQELIRLKPGDIGRPITDFAPALAGTSLLADVGVVLAENKDVRAELASSHGKWLLRRTLPYRTADGSLEGVIITITDITDAKSIAEEHQKLQRDSATIDAQREEVVAFEQRVVERTRQLRSLAFNTAQTAELEHRRIARIVHDDLLQQIALLRIKFEGLRGPGGEQGAQLVEMLPLLESCARTARQIVAELSPPGLYEFGLVPALDWLANEMKKQFGLNVRLRGDDKPDRLAPDAAAVLFR